MPLQYGRVPIEIISDPRLSDSAVRVYAALAFCRNGQSKRCNPSQTKLAEMTGKSVSTISRSLKELTELEVVQRKFLNGSETRYTLPCLENEDDPTPVKSAKDTPETDKSPVKSTKDKDVPFAEMQKTPVKSANIPPHPPNKDEPNKEPQQQQPGSLSEYEKQMVEFWEDFIAPDEEPPLKHFALWGKTAGEAVALNATLHMALTGKVPDDPIAYLPSLFASAKKGELSTQRSGHPLLQDPAFKLSPNGRSAPTPMKHLSDAPKIIDSNWDPITDPEERRAKILARNPQATEDPDQGQSYTLSSDYITGRSATP